MFSKEKIYDFFNNNKKCICKLCVAFIISIIISVILEDLFFKKYYFAMAIDRIFIITCAVFFIFMHFIIPIKSMYEFIYKKRFILAISLLLILVLLQYSGSSINMYRLYVPTENEQNTVILGKSRAIRSDEWAVNTPLSFSQNMNKNGKNLSYYNDIVRATPTDMFTIIHAPLVDILTLGKPFTIGYIFGNNIGLSFWWYGRLIALLLVSFEFCMLITNRNKLVSLCGMLMITFAPATQWWYSNFLPDLLIWGQLAILMIDRFLSTKELKVKIISAVILGISGVSFIFAFYPTWQVPFGYIYAAILIWVIIKNKKSYKFVKTDLLIITIVIICMGLLGIRYYSMSKDTLNAVMNTSYPGDRFELGGCEINNVFGYVYNIFTAFKETANPSEVSTMLSYYPIPIIVALIYMIKNQKGKDFIMPLFIVTVLFTIWTFVKTNEIFAKITLLYMVPGNRITIPLGALQTYLIIYILGNIKDGDKILNENVAKILAFVATLIILHISIKNAPADYIGPMIGFVSGFIVLSVIYLLFSSKFENKRKLIYLLSAISIIGGIAVNPVIKGTDIIYETELAKEIKKIIKDDSGAIWMYEGDGFPIPNYLVANGARTINSTNYYPNLEMLNILLGDSLNNEENKEVYNRYAHIKFKITDEDTNIQLLYEDQYVINVNYNKLKDLNVSYILSRRELADFSNEDVSFNKIYQDESMYIYSINFFNIEQEGD